MFCSPSKTLRAKAIGPKMLRTIRKKVRIVSMTSEADWKRISSNLRMTIWTIPCREKAYETSYMVCKAVCSSSLQPMLSSSASSSSLEAKTRPVIIVLAIMSARSLSFSCWYFCKSKVWSRSSIPVPWTIGLKMPLRVPSTITSKKRIHMPNTKGRSIEKTSIGSARESDCQTR